MSLINCKVELKLGSTKCWFLAAPVADNTNTNPNDIIFSIKDMKLYVALSTKGNQILSTFLARDLKIQCIWMCIQ